MILLGEKEKELLHFFTKTKECSAIKDILVRRLDEKKVNLVKVGLDRVPFLQGEARELEELIKLFTIKLKD